MELITKEYVSTHLPERSPMGHKGTFGKVYVLGGCTGYTGAPVYAGEAAMRTGSGLVYVGVPGEIYPIIAARCESAMAQPWPDYEELLKRMQSCGAILLGPGLGQAEKTSQLVRDLLKELTVPVVLDADGINAVSTHMDVLENRRGITVLTPHEGEFARLDPTFVPGKDGPYRARAAADFVRQYGCTLVLKGPGTIAAAPGGPPLRNSTGGSGLAKGGSGDILAGMILSLLGQGASPGDAAACAVWLHGRAGDLAERELTAYAMTPADLLGWLPAAFKDLEEL